MDLNNLIKSLSLPNDEYITIGVSAGPDSMALLHLIEKNITKKIVCIHINHNTRPSCQDEENYLRKYCHTHHLLFECYHIESYQGKNFENEARQIRYKFYEKILTKYHSHTLFLAHHGDDLIETILMKIIRGSNLEGYAGIKKYSYMNQYTIIRPLLDITKEDLIKYNHQHKITFFIDSTNEDTSYMRNRLRKTLLPLLKKEDPQIHLKFLKYSHTLEEYYNYIEKITLEKIKTTYSHNLIDLNLFKKEDIFMKKNILFYLLSNLYHHQANIIKDKHLTSIIKLTESPKPNMILSLPQNYYVKKSYHFLSFCHISNIQKTDTYRFLFKDQLIIDNLLIKKVKTTSKDGNDICRLNISDITLPLYIRNRKNGDRIAVLGLDGHKKVNEIFIENKIPQNVRQTYPLLVDANDNILWIPNMKKSKYNIPKNKLCDIILTCYQKGGNKIEK